MQEKDKNASTFEFLRSFGPKITCGEVYFEEDDQCDQRAPVNNPEELYNAFILPEEVMDELESERVEDFDNDFYDYEDRTDLGVDIAAASELSLRRKNNKPVEQPVPEDKPVDEPAD